MTKDIISKRIILYDLIGFGVVILILWLDELIDVPHLLFGAAATPVNIREVVAETAVVILLGIGVIGVTWQLLQRVKYLEGFLPVCSFCKKIRVGDAWIPIVDYITDHSEALFTHGCCPQCTEEHYGHLMSNRKIICA